MGKVYQNVEELIGKTPLMEVSRIEEVENWKPGSTRSWNYSIRREALKTEWRSP